MGDRVFLYGMRDKDLKPIVITPQHRYLEYDFELRWCLFYPEQKIAGLWTQTSPNLADSAAANTREGLVEAVIQSKDRRTRLIETIVRCPGVDFIEFRWIYVTPAPMRPSMLPKGIEFKFQGTIHGLTLVSRAELIHCHIDGKAMREPNNERTCSKIAWGN